MDQRTSARPPAAWGRQTCAFHPPPPVRSEEHTSELQSLTNLVCRLLLEKKNRAHSPRGFLAPHPDAQSRRTHSGSPTFHSHGSQNWRLREHHLRHTSRTQRDQDAQAGL